MKDLNQALLRSRRPGITAIDPGSRQDLPPEAQPHRSIVYLDDRQIIRIAAERLPVEETVRQTSVEILSNPARF